MTSTMKLENRTAVITGAASGIGRGIAVALARRGCNLALADVNDAGLSETARLAQSSHSDPTNQTPPRSALRISQHHLDVADRRAIAVFPQAVIAAHPGVDILVNNAGVAVGGTFEAVSEEDFEWLFEINFWGVVRMTRAFLPLLRKSDDARVVNLSSIYGLISPPAETASRQASSPCADFPIHCATNSRIRTSVLLSFTRAASQLRLPITREYPKTCLRKKSLGAEP